MRKQSFWKEHWVGIFTVPLALLSLAAYLTGDSVLDGKIT
jgi:hypothetical protein